MVKEQERKVELPGVMHKFMHFIVVCRRIHYCVVLLRLWYLEHTN